MTPEVKAIRKTIFAWMKQYAKTHPDCRYHSGTLWFDISYAEVPALGTQSAADANRRSIACAQELVELLKPLISHDKIIKHEKLGDGYPKEIFKQTFANGVWGDGNNYPALICSVTVQTGGPYAGVGVLWNARNKFYTGYEKHG